MTFDDINSRFVGALDALTKNDASSKICIAVSGGPDSVALLLLAHSNFADRICAATVDHQLRPEARAEAEFVAAICVGRNIPHIILRPAQPITGNIQSAARAERYRLLDDWAAQQDCQWIATAHHAEDQLETLLMRLARGSGVAGMAGIRSVNGNIIRPLLGFTKAELIAVCQDAGVTSVTDPSNEDRDFDRVRMRQWLALGHPLGVDGPVRTAHALADAAEALDWIVRELEPVRITATPEGIAIDPANLPHELQRRLLLIGLRRLETGLDPRGAALDSAIFALHTGHKTMLGNVMCRGGPTWRLSLAPSRRTVSR
jgi:tRNA(Ile)-lysidine synthase